MKKLIALALVAGAFLMTTGCENKQEIEPKIHTRYVTQGYYYAEGTVITNDGNIWDYHTDIISDKPSYDHQAVNVGFDDNGTPDNITDDIVLGLTWDVETSIYDRLEIALSDKFDLDREGNNIKINEMKQLNTEPEGTKAFVPFIVYSKKYTIN